MSEQREKLDTVQEALAGLFNDTSASPDVKETSFGEVIDMVAEFMNTLPN